jgi:hypothetical protein
MFGNVALYGSADNGGELARLTFLRYARRRMAWARWMNWLLGQADGEVM